MFRTIVMLLTAAWLAAWGGVSAQAAEAAPRLWPPATSMVARVPAAASLQGVPKTVGGLLLGTRTPIASAAGFASALFAQADASWPKLPTFERGPGGYLSWWKLLLIWIVFVLWLHTTNWINRDSQIIGKDIGLSDAIWNPLVFFTFLLGFFVAATWILPFFVGFPVYFLTWAVPVAVYVATRNGRVEPPDKVLTGAHIKKWFKQLGKKKKVERKLMPWEMGPPIVFRAGGITPQHEQANLIEARQVPAFVPAKELLADAMVKRADRILLDYTAESVAVRYEVDGMWHNAPTRDRQTGDAMLFVFKRLAGLNPDERRARQEGKFRADYMGVKHDCTLASQGVKTGERVVLQIVRPGAKLKTLDELGMRDKMRDQLTGLINGGPGLILLSAPPGGGLSTTWHVTMRAKDRYIKECVSVENAAQREEEVENVTVTTFNLPAGETPDKILPQLLLKQPDVLFVPDMVNGATVDILCAQALEEDRLVISRVPAKDAVDALLRVAALRPDMARYSKAVVAALGQRLVRKLCPSCKQAYEPNPQLLQRLGIPPGRVQAFFREYQPPPPEQLVDAKGRPIAPPPPCPQCGGLGYLGRTAIFELLSVDDRLRQALAQGADANALRQYARQAGHRGLQEEGILLVAQGVTSIQELQRVLQQ